MKTQKTNEKTNPRGQNEQVHHQDIEAQIEEEKKKKK